MADGIVEWKEGNRYRNNLPKSGFNGVCHIRPKGQNRVKSMIVLPNGQELPNQAFWFNAKFIKELTLDIL